MGTVLTVQVGEYGRLKEQLLAQEELQVRIQTRHCMVFSSTWRSPDASCCLAFGMCHCTVAGGTR
jgi:hypothetical protein